MPITYPAAIEGVTPEWLSNALSLSGVSEGATVSSVAYRSNDAFNSSVAHLELRYSDDAPAAAPRRLLLKLNGDHDGEAEVELYNLVATLRDHPPVLPRCYAASYSPDSGRSYLLLEDLSQTHAPPVSRRQLLSGRGVPSDAQLDGIIDTLARFHAYWWEHPRLGTGIARIRPWYCDLAAYEAHIERREGEWARFIATVGDSLPADLHAVYSRTLAGMHGLWGSYLEPRVTGFRGVTLSHGDCYLTQFLCPRDPSSGGCTYVVDFQDVSGNFGPYDLSYLIPTYWGPEQRAEGRREERLLRRYLHTLKDAGVEHYGWDDLLTDYKLMVTLMLFDPVFNQVSGSPESVWRPKMQCLAAAYRDLGCRELLPD